MILDSVRMKFSVVPVKVAKIQRCKSILSLKEALNRRWVKINLIRSFGGLFVFLSLSLTWEQFYIRSLYWHFFRRLGATIWHVSHQLMPEISFRKRLAKRPELSQGQPVRPSIPQASIHIYAAVLGYGGTVNFDNMSTGMNGLCCNQRVWW